MVRHNETIHRQIALSVSYHFVGLALKGLKVEASWDFKLEMINREKRSLSIFCIESESMGRECQRAGT